MIEILRPRIDLYPSFVRFAEDMRSSGETIWEGYYPKEGESPDQFIARLNRRETHPEAPLVAELTYWGTLDGQVAGRISLHPELNEKLRIYGGHIGYEVAPKFRRRGLAKEMLRLLLLTSEAQEIGKLLLTCSPDHPASNRTITANGGVLEKAVFVDFIGENRNHYWIKTQQPSTPKISKS